MAVTGASGFLGRAIVRHASTGGWQVRAITRSLAAVPGATETIVAGDLANAAPGPLLAGCSAVIHCAARVHVARPHPAEAALAMAANRDLTLRLARAARREGVRHFIFASSAAAIASSTAAGETADEATLPRPSNPYGRSKLSAEAGLAALAAPGFATLSLRPPAIIGPGGAGWFPLLARAARAGLPLPVAGIANRRSFACLDNVADAFVAALQSGMAGAFFVTDSAPMSTADLYRRMLALCGHGDLVWRWPPALAAALARLLLGARADSLVGNAAFDGRAFRTSAGWSAPLSFEEGLRAALGCGGPAPRAAGAAALSSATPR